jgi:hypothetical protein
MHIAAIRDDPDDFALRRQHLGLKICQMWEMHDLLVRVYPTTSTSGSSYYSAPKPYLLIDIPKGNVFQGEPFTEGLRKIRVSGSDIVYRYMLEASTCVRVQPEQYRQFDRLNPQSLPCLYYILQNVYMTARSMDESTVHYLLEADEVSQQMRSIFISLCVVASVVELITVLAIFRPALTRIYAEMTEKVNELANIDDRRLRAMNAQGAIHSSHHSKVPVANAKAGTKKGERRRSSADSEVDSDDESVQSVQQLHETEGNAHEGDAEAELSGLAHQSLENKVFAPTEHVCTSPPTNQHHWQPTTQPINRPNQATGTPACKNIAHPSPRFAALFIDAAEPLLPQLNVPH